MTTKRSHSTVDALPMRWAVILMAAALVAVVVGGLTLLQTASWPATLLAALGTAGMSIPVSHQVVGR